MGAVPSVIWNSPLRTPDAETPWSPGQGAPISTHFVRLATTSAGASSRAASSARPRPGGSPRREGSLRLAGYDRRPGVAAGERSVARVEPQARLRLVGPVTLRTVVGEDRADLRLEEAELLLRRLRPVGEGRGDKDEARQQDGTGERCGMRHRGGGWGGRRAGSADRVYRTPFRVARSRENRPIACRAGTRQDVRPASA